MLKEMKLYNDITIPIMGFGTWQIDNAITKKTIKDALKIGYRHIDTAIMYNNQKEVGEGIKESQVKRSNLFITSKIPAEVKTYNEAKENIKLSLQNLGLNYIDLMLIHAPRPFEEMNSLENRYYEENLQVYKALEEAYEEGIIKAIGVSNFDVLDLKNIIDNANIKPMVNQIEFNIYHKPWDIIEFCQKEGIVVEAYSPIALAKKIESDKIKKMARKYNATISQLCLQFAIQHNTVTISKTTHKEFMKENLFINFNISDEDMNILENISR